MEIQVALITGGTAVVAAIIGWFAQIAVVSLKGNRSPAFPTNGSLTSVIDGRIGIHTTTCANLRTILDTLAEMREDMKEHLKEHRLNAELSRSQWHNPTRSDYSRPE